MDRVGTALARLQRSACAISMLRTRVEATMNDETASDKDGNDHQHDLAKVLQLVNSAQLLLKEMSAKADSARFLQEFIVIINSTAKPVEEIQGEMQHLVPLAEAALAEMQQAISSVSTALSPTSRQDMDPSILAQAAALTAIGSSSEVLIDSEAGRRIAEKDQSYASEETADRLVAV